ncbi:hypothetical protein ABB02_00464 [Clostridiaceae bacterium JG1575]|nr:hypothetical protein ABB02_00464 [Clostridiaceae bacterium JG1575]
MIVCIYSAKEGVGGSTLAVLLAALRAASHPTILLDAGEMPSHDIYTKQDQKIRPDFQGDPGTLTTPRGFSKLRTGRVAPTKESLELILPFLLQERSKEEWIFLDGAPDFWRPALQAQQGLPALVVISQDNTVLRSADRLLGEFHRSGRSATLIINQWEETSSDFMEDLYRLFEEEVLGTLPRVGALRSALNQGELAIALTLMERPLQELLDSLTALAQGAPLALGGTPAIEQPSEAAQGFFQRLRRRWSKKEPTPNEEQ